MEVHVVDTFTATIYVGFKERSTGQVYDIDLVHNICREYCDKVGLCVTLTPTEYIYTNGSEKGCIIGLINYPRFPAEKNLIMFHAMKIAELCKKELNQMRVTVVTPVETIMLSDDEEQA